MKLVKRLSLLVLLLLIGCQQGPKVQISENEEIFYKGSATEEQARAVGEVLTQRGILTGSNPASIQLIGKDGAFTLRLVIKEDRWEDDQLAQTFGDIAFGISQDALDGAEVSVEFCDDHFKTQRTFPMAELAKVQLTPNEIIFLLGSATEEQGRAVGASLTRHGLLDGSNPASMQLHLEGDKINLRFVVKEGLWDNEMMIESFAEAAYNVSQEVFEGREVMVDLCDDHFNPRNTFPMRHTPVMTFGPEETVIYQAKIGEEKARAVGQVLQKVGYFSGSSTATVQLRQNGEGYRSMFVVRDGFWDKQELYPQWESLRAQLSEVLDGKPVTLELCDSTFTAHKSFGP